MLDVVVYLAFCAVITGIAIALDNDTPKGRVDTPYVLLTFAIAPIAAALMLAGIVARIIRRARDA